MYIILSSSEPRELQSASYVVLNINPRPLETRIKTDTHHQFMFTYNIKYTST